MLKYEVQPTEKIDRSRKTVIGTKSTSQIERRMLRWKDRETEREKECERKKERGLLF